MKLPNYERAVVPEAKITRYLLNLASENGKSKARFFLAFGFTIEAWHVLAKALKRHAEENAVAHVEDRKPFGVHYVVEGPIRSPDGRNPNVRVVWIMDSGEDVPRLVSAYPLGGGE